jgi:hypothetical protein
MRESVLDCAGPPALSNVHRPAQSSRGLEHSKTLPRLSNIQRLRKAFSISAKNDLQLRVRESVLDCAGPPALSNIHRPAQSSKALEH